MDGPKGFFDLPAEIRNIMYRLAFENNQLVHPRLAVKRIKDVDKVGRILCVNKTFNTEAAPFIYGTRQFKFSNIFNGILFTIRIGKDNANHLKSLQMGTFWYKYREAATLGWKYDNALPLTSKFLAQRCSQLEFLKIGDLSTEGDKNDWRIKTLEYLKTLVDALPQLSNVSYSERGQNLQLTKPKMAIPARRTAFDVDVEIKKRKDATKARRSAAGKKANVVKRAKKAGK